MKEIEPFEQSLKRYRGLLFTVCQRYSRRGADIDDLLQEVTIALWKKHAEMESIAPLPRQAAWVWRLAKNASIDYLRRLRPTEALPEGLEEDLRDDDTGHHDNLQECIKLLDEPDKSIVSYHLDGYRYEEIAAKTGLTVSNISVRLVRIREKLKKIYNNGI